MATSRFRKVHNEPQHGDLDPRLDTVRSLCLGKPGATEDFPFGPEAMVIKVGDKIFAIIGWEALPVVVSLKCDPEHVPQLREKYDAIRPAPYLAKKHWNAVTVDATVTDDVLQELVDHSYDLVRNSLTRKAQAMLNDNNS